MLVAPVPLRFTGLGFFNDRVSQGRPHISWGKGKGFRCRVPCIASIDDDLIRGVHPENKIEVARVLDKTIRAASRWGIEHTDFLTPPVVADAKMCIRRLAGVRCVVSGGYEHAERCRLSVGDADNFLEDYVDGIGVPEAVCLLNIEGKFSFDAASHRDFLGAILGLGLKRAKIGDILVQEDRGAQVIVAPDVAAFLQSELVQVRSVKCFTTQVPLSELCALPPKIETGSTSEASMRLDVLASAAFRISRTQMVERIAARDVQVNWKRASKPSVALATGDVVSLAGSGRVEIGEVTLTKKGRYLVEFKRFV
eukprot:jgi/Mesvir1/22363/Mv17865-RA.1